MKAVLGQPYVLWALVFFLLGMGFTSRFDVPLAVFAFAAALAFGEPQDASSSARWKDHWPVALFVLVAIMTTALSLDVRHSLSVQPQFLPSLLCYAVITTFVTDKGKVRFVCLGLLLSGLVTAVVMVLASSASLGADPLAQVRLMGSALMVVPNDALLMSVIAPLALALAWDGQREMRWLLLLYVLVALLAGILLQSRQTVLLLLFGLVVVVTLLRPRWVLPILLGGVLVGVVVDGLLGWPLAGKIFMFPRAYVWHTAWVMFLDRPWTGHGPGMFKDLYFTYLERAGYVLEQLGDRRTMPWAHNLYLEQLAERGIPGLVALLVLMGSALGKAWSSGKDGVLTDRVMQAGLTASLLVMAAAGIAEATLSRLWVAVLLFCLVALAQVQWRLCRQEV